jgi:hypothetical protein
MNLGIVMRASEGQVIVLAHSHDITVLRLPTFASHMIVYNKIN